MLSLPVADFAIHNLRISVIQHFYRHLQFYPVLSLGWLPAKPRELSLPCCLTPRLGKNR